MCKFIMFITAVCVLFFIKLRWPNNKSLYDTMFNCFQSAKKVGAELVRTITSIVKGAARFFSCSKYCAVPEKTHTYPMEGHQNFLGEGGLKSQNFKGKV